MTSNKSVSWLWVAQLLFGILLSIGGYFGVQTLDILREHSERISKIETSRFDSSKGIELAGTMTSLAETVARLSETTTTLTAKIHELDKNVALLKQEMKLSSYRDSR